MLDVKRLLKDPDQAAAALARRSPDLSLEPLLATARERRAATSAFNDLRSRQKQASKAFGKARATGADDLEARQSELKGVSEEVKALEARMKELDDALRQASLELPNLPSAETPDGTSEADNVVVRTWGEPRVEEGLQGHDVIATALDIVDFEAGARVSGSRFVLYKGLGARLERALWSFMLDLHTDEHGYTEVLPPFLVLRDSMEGTGQLPKFEEDAFRCDPDDLFLIPTAEVPVTNLHRGEILEPDAVPKRYAAFSACFRREAGSYGRDTQGLTRLHQFQKVELVQFVRPEDSDAAHQALTGHAEKVLQLLGLPYRVSELCAGDLGFSAQRCYDLEVWLPGQSMWREISSCSNFGDFQARRANIRFRPAAGEKPQHVHTLNGSGLAVGRTIMALIEHYQDADGGVRIPEALQPYMRTDRIAPAT